LHSDTSLSITSGKVLVGMTVGLGEDEGAIKVSGLGDWQRDGL
jgi:hypothetical protein